MSQFVWGIISFSEIHGSLLTDNLCFSLVRLCAENRFGIDFKNKNGIPPEVSINSSTQIKFTLSDNFLISNCDKFMRFGNFCDLEPLKEIKKDLSKIELLLRCIFENKKVENVLLYFCDDGNANLDEYEIIDVGLEDFNAKLIEKYSELFFEPTFCVRILAPKDMFGLK